MIPYPKISPNIVTIFGFGIRWYSVMYLLGYWVGFSMIKQRRIRGLFRVPALAIDTLISYLVIGMLLGARTFYVLFYNLEYYVNDPLEIPKIWHGGLSFHGAVVGMVLACALFSRRFKVGFFETTDTMAMAAGPGLFFGRIGNFINGELYGRASNLPWAMIFPADEKQIPRHPSQIYQGLTEGLLLWGILMLLQKYLLKHKRYRPGQLGGSFLVGYGIFRFFTEFTREPDAQLGYVFSIFSMGQILCVVMALLGVFVVWRSRKSPILVPVRQS